MTFTILRVVKTHISYFRICLQNVDTLKWDIAPLTTISIYAQNRLSIGLNADMFNYLKKTVLI